jgi:ribosomal protein S12 methylthiotransferase
VQSVVAEVRQLVAEGVKEVNLISQDTTFFGMDTWEERPNPRTPVDSSRGTALTSLLRELNAIEGDFWIRILYTHPAHWSDELIKTIAECPKVARYVDMPLQHISDRMLTAMQRETSGDTIRNLVRRIRSGIPGIALRTTFIVGFPGETEEDVDELCAFIREARFERLGVFRYSQEEGTRAAKMGAQVPSKEKERRWHRVMALQRDIASSVSSASVGRTLKVLVDEVGVARGEADAPDIDGRVYVPRELAVGSFAEVTINGHHDYDLLALPAGASPAEYKVAKQAQ